ncbi:helix-turn-helix transcriptional regulator [Schleiferilactobacillus harbinensis]|jgi:putative transcriptional regulator|uniref:helix-turn-helix transcriptional regulator n=2 Tax=Schleiferilactobacillus harbinensis TaxID=304207 RepID=UPI00242C5FB8|nr:helix-turn-helix transcriptional regulator [Schleiferilactobacillus harbinensis]MCI1687831.1 helix-turn-helix transcriptional regulator [Schleiferilactobacillus harbinensis]MCI1784104.1 helix-turn-helix transcriptional regulator [Schleiferilactobacillus harbinensis]MCI1849242.1 helix-turn-helix transcriptional regulator [Schleiferilactobacillus harbinensis]
MPMKVVNRVAEVRRAQGLTQAELADRVGVTRRTIISLEKGNYTPSLILGLMLADVFDLPVQALFTLKED